MPAEGPVSTAGPGVVVDFSGRRQDSDDGASPALEAPEAPQTAEGGWQAPRRPARQSLECACFLNRGAPSRARALTPALAVPAEDIGAAPVRSRVNAPLLARVRAAPDREAHAEHVVVPVPGPRRAARARAWRRVGGRAHGLPREGGGLGCLLPHALKPLVVELLLQVRKRDDPLRLRDVDGGLRLVETRAGLHGELVWQQPWYGSATANCLGAVTRTTSVHHDVRGRDHFL